LSIDLIATMEFGKLGRHATVPLLGLGVDRARAVAALVDFPLIVKAFEFG
jgi:hypothetical protein